MNNIWFKPKILDNYFSDYVRFLCRSCKRYNKKASCPPHIDSVEKFKYNMTRFENGILVYHKFQIDDINNWETLGKESSMLIAKALQKMNRQFTYRKNYLILGAGSCKNCKKCSFPCRYPEKKIIPLEATGIDVMKLFKELTNIELKFPVEDYGYFYRIGVLLFT